jgi:tRNA (guanine26-N2/guanine27-N2)-dimethyltransferase
MGRLSSRDFLSSVLTELKRVESQSARDAERLLRTLRDEDEVTLPYVNTHKLVKGSGVSPPSTQRLIIKLRSQGYEANPTHFDPKAVKTNAPLTQLMEAARSIGGKTV